MQEAGEALDLRHRARIEALLAATELPFSEASFANLYLYRDRHRYRFVDGARPHILGTTYDGVRHCLALTSSEVGRAHGEDCCRYPARHAVGATHNPDDSDYLYDAASLASLASPAVRAKRQQAMAYAGTHAPTLALDAPSFEPAAFALLELWQAQTGKSSDDTDYAVCREAIQLAAALGMETALLTGSGTPHGFLIASRLPDGSKAVHFAKARRDIVGPYPWMFSAYAQVAGVATLNFEQDLGHPGLRRAKRALDPREQLHKYRIFGSLSDAGPIG